MNGPEPSGGYSLVELIITVSIVAVLVGVSLPLASTVLERQRRTATTRELDGLAAATEAYFLDVGELPTAVAALEQHPGVDGWAGPYLDGLDLDGASGLSQYSRDGWGEPYVVTISPDGHTWGLTSPGPDGMLGVGDDLSVALEVVPLRRALTLERLARLEEAIRRYNALCLPSQPLPATLPELLAELEASGILTDTSGLRQDGWGDPFEPDPPGAAPVVRLRSIHLGPSAGGW